MPLMKPPIINSPLTASFVRFGQRQGNAFPPDSERFQSSRKLFTDGLVGQLLRNLQQEKKYEKVVSGEDRHATSTL